MSLKIATWNVNSIRARIELAGRFVAEHKPDVLCLQETKAADPVFPGEQFERWGYTYQALSGAVGAPGVAILSRRPFTRVFSRDWCGRTDHRHIEGCLENGLEIHNYYVPAGGDIPDPERNPKFVHKMDFLAEMADWYGQRPDRDQPALLVGDLNVAPYQTDVWSHERLRRVITHTETEVAALAAVRQSYCWVDVMREFVPKDQFLFTWWSYRAGDWQVANKGRRLDHVWATPATARHCKHLEVLTEARGWPRPSDHVPVIVDLDMD